MVIVGLRHPSRIWCSAGACFAATLVSACASQPAKESTVFAAPAPSAAAAVLKPTPPVLFPGEQPQPAPVQDHNTKLPRIYGLERPKPDDAVGIRKIKHVIIIMQENRSFDEYFGTFPGADGIPMKDGLPAVCVPNPTTGTCDAPYHNPRT